jgi:hypothetical protein
MYADDSGGGGGEEGKQDGRAQYLASSVLSKCGRRSEDQIFLSIMARSQIFIGQHPLMSCRKKIMEPLRELGID